MYSATALAGLAVISGLAYAQSPPLSDFSDADIANGVAWQNVSDVALQRMQSNINSRPDQTCNFDNAAVRTEFRKMSKPERKSLTDAFMCLQNMAPQVMTDAESANYPGIKSRYDEYVATHINYTTNIHMTADFLAWHRFFTFNMEQDLKNMCGYTGNLPYWDWAMDAAALDQSEVFNGDEYSMGGNGEYIAGRNYTYLGLQNLNFPPGTGGGCVQNGPFSDYQTHLGPLDSPYDNNVENQFDLNSRCLVRDLNSWFSTQFNTYTNVTDLLLNQIYIEDFQAIMQGYGDSTPANPLGVHGGGHWLGGGPSQLEDFHSSPNDPMFFLHHAMIDRIWTVWQYLDISNRQNIIRGTSTLNNDPASPDMQLTDVLPFGFITEDQTFSTLMDTFAGPYCYRYD